MKWLGPWVIGLSEHIEEPSAQEDT